MKTTNIDILDPYLENIKKKYYDSYQAYLTVCLKGKKKVNENCEELFDTKGPYKSEKQCMDRVYEMKIDLPKYKPKFEPKDHLCELEKVTNKDKRCLLRYRKRSY